MTKESNFKWNVAHLMGGVMKNLGNFGIAFPNEHHSSVSSGMSLDSTCNLARIWQRNIGNSWILGLVLG